MNAVELLGGLLGNKSGSSGAGAAILKNLIGGVFKGSGQTQSQGQAAGSGSQQRSGGVDLGDMVRDALSKFQKRGGGAAASSQASQCNDPAHRASAGTGGSSELDDAKAVVLIRAMINSAKADGKLDQREQDSIVKQLGQVTQDEARFLQQEFARPVDVREFVWSVPLGLEQQVYGISLMAIDLDQNKEAAYLRDLAHGLRLTPDVCNRIHQHYKAPVLYK